MRPLILPFTLNVLTDLMSLAFQFLRAAREDRAEGKGAQQGSGQYLEHLAPGHELESCSR